MLNFIILGYVPGTTFQITFMSFIVAAWLICIVSITLWYGIYFAVRKKVRDIATIKLIAMQP